MERSGPGGQSRFNPGPQHRGGGARGYHGEMSVFFERSSCKLVLPVALKFFISS